MAEDSLKNFIDGGEMYRRIVEFSGEGFWVVDQDLKTSFINRSTAELFGFSIAEMLGKSLLDFVFEEDREKVFQRRQTRLDDLSQTLNYDFRYRRKNDEEFWLHLDTHSIYCENGEYIGTLAVVKDITEQRRIEKAALQFASIAESSSDAIIGKNLDGLITSWNYGAEKLFGYTEQEIVGQPINVLIPENLQHEEKQIIDRVKNNESVEHFETVRKTRSGEEIVVSLTVSPIRDAVGNIIGASKIARDIGEERTIRKSLLQAENRAPREYLALLKRIVPLAQTLGAARNLEIIYRAVAEFVRVSMPCSAVFVSSFDAQTNLQTAVYGWTLHGESDVSNLPPILLTPTGGINSRAVFEGKPIVVNRFTENARKRPHILLEDDGIDPHSSLAVPMKIMNRVVGTIEIQAAENEAFTDEHIVATEMVANLAAVSVENVRLLETEARARSEAETANRAKDEFLSILSHELRTPLNAMYGWVRMLRAGMLDEEQSKHAVEVIERNISLQNNLIEDLLDTSRIVSGKIRIEETEVDFIKIIKTALENALPAAAQKNIKLEFARDTAPVLVSGDEVRLVQILTNLLNNALKFTPNGGKIAVEAEANDSTVKIRVTDSGIGIEKEFQTVIFDRFRQADGTTRRSFSGLGLGLPLAKHLTEIHGGQISVHSDGKNSGSTFTLEFPILKTSGAAAAEVSRNIDAETEIGSVLKNKKILLVDDNCEGLAPLQLILEMQNAEVECLESGLKALDELAVRKFDLLVSDIGMPEIDGYDLIETLRKDADSPNQKIPAIALTAYAQTEDQELALASGFNCHVSKPVDFDEFLLAAKNLLVNLPETV